MKSQLSNAFHTSVTIQLCLEPGKKGIVFLRDSLRVVISSVTICLFTLPLICLYRSDSQITALNSSTVVQKFILNHNVLA